MPSRRLNAIMLRCQWTTTKWLPPLQTRRNSSRTRRSKARVARAVQGNNGQTLPVSCRPSTLPQWSLDRQLSRASQTETLLHLQLFLLTLPMQPACLLRRTRARNSIRYRLTTLARVTIAAPPVSLTHSWAKSLKFPQQAVRAQLIPKMQAKWL